MSNNPAEQYQQNEASSFEGEACETGANEPPAMTEHIYINNPTTYTSLPPTEQRPDH